MPLTSPMQELLISRLDRIETKLDEVVTKFNEKYDTLSERVISIESSLNTRSKLSNELIVKIATLSAFVSALVSAASSFFH